VNAPVWTTTSAFLRELEGFDIKFSPEERRALVQRAEQSIRETTGIMAQREKDRLLRMPVQTDLIQ
jgi:hypothetical protein